MFTGLQCGMSVLLLVLSIPYSLTNFRLIEMIRPEMAVGRIRRVFFSLLTAGLFVAAGAAGLPLPFFYVSLYLIFSLFFLSLPCGKLYGFLVVNMGASFFAVVHLTLLGITALIAQCGVNAILADGNMRLVCLALALAIHCSLGYFLQDNSMRQKIGLLARSGKEFELFVLFSWFIAGYALFDSIPSMFSLSYSMASLYLIGSNLLLVLQISVFISHVYKIARDAYLEAEHDRLEAIRTEQIARTRYLQKTAFKDGLTGIYTRKYGLDRMESLLKEGKGFAVVFMDLDHLKQVNDKYGHSAGDRYLMDFARIFSGSLRRDDVFSRYGGDEFLVLMPCCDREHARRRILNIRENVNRDITKRYPISFSFGVSVAHPMSEQTVKELLSEADEEMYREKTAKRSES